MHKGRATDIKTYIYNRLLYRDHRNVPMNQGYVYILYNENSFCDMPKQDSIYFNQSFKYTNTVIIT